MDRQIIYPSSIPLDSDLLNTQRNIMVALGFLAQAAFGTATVADGLACTQQTVPNLTFNVGPGSILSLQTVDGTTFGSLPADNSDPLVKMGVNVASQTFTVTAPTTSGQSINYLVQAEFQESDATAVVLPYYNSANPAVAFSGPSNSGTPQNTQRLQRVNLGVKAGTPNATGSQVTPNPDSGFVGLWVVTVAFAATTVVTGNITAYPTAPFIGTKLPQLRTKLTGNLNLYVNGTTGSDVNNGFATTTALATLNGAWNRIFQSLDLSGFSVTVNVADGNYASAVFAGVPVGAGQNPVGFVGNVANPDNCVVTAVNTSGFTVLGSAQVSLAGFKVTASGTSPNQGCGVLCGSAGSVVGISGNMDFSSCAVADLAVVSFGQITILSSYKISGTSGCAWYCSSGGFVNAGSGITVTLVSTPVFTNAFAYAGSTGSVIQCSSITFAGTATGTKYVAAFGGFVNTNSSGNVNILPGSSAGSSTTGYYN